jgi:3-oxoacyl-[acyl-carrier protein] reductase
VTKSPGDRVAGKIALVTGAANGLGRAIAQRLAEEGATLVLVDIDSAGLAETERLIKTSSTSGSNQPPMAITADVTEEAPVKALFQQVLATHGRLDILVNDVGGGTTGHIWEAKLEDWDYVIKLKHAIGFLCTREATAHMRERARAASSTCPPARARARRGPRPTSATRPMRRRRRHPTASTRGVALELADFAACGSTPWRPARSRPSARSRASARSSSSSTGRSAPRRCAESACPRTSPTPCSISPPTRRPTSPAPRLPSAGGR